MPDRHCQWTVSSMLKASGDAKFLRRLEELVEVQAVVRRERLQQVDLRRRMSAAT